MSLLKICLVISTFVFCALAQRNSPGPLTSYQHLCSPGEIIEESENGEKFYYVNENCMRKLRKMIDDFETVAGNGGYQHGNSGCQRGNGGCQEGNGGYQQSYPGHPQNNGGYQQGNGDYQQNNGGYDGTGANEQEKPQPQSRGKKMFELQSAEADFYQAQRNCVASGKGLAKILNKEEQDMLEEKIINEGDWTTEFWIGGHYVRNTLTWVNTSQNIMYGKWAQGFPPRTKQPQGCVMVNDEDNGYRWTVAQCTRFASYVCEYYEPAHQ